MKAATNYTNWCGIKDDISIHAAREGGDKWGPKSQAGFDISIHAAREGGDENNTLIVTKLYISIHAAREGGDCR